MSETPGTSPRRPPPVSTSVTVPYRVRFDECGPDGFARTSTLLRYAQDVAWVHAEELGIDRAWTAAHGLTWVVRAVEVAVLRAIPVGAMLHVTTRLGGTRKVLARRRTEVRLHDGTLASWGHTDWVVIDGRGMPARLPGDFLDRFDVAAGAFEPVRVRLPSEPPGASRVHAPVRPQDLDPLAHVNNGAYLDYLEEALLAAGPSAEVVVRAIPRIVRLEYLVPAAAGVQLRGAAWAERGDGSDATWAWRLTNQLDQELARGRITSLMTQ